MNTRVVSPIGVPRCGRGLASIFYIRGLDVAGRALHWLANEQQRRRSIETQLARRQMAIQPWPTANWAESCTAVNRGRFDQQDSMAFDLDDIAHCRPARVSSWISSQCDRTAKMVYCRRKCIDRAGRLALSWTSTSTSPIMDGR